MTRDQFAAALRLLVQRGRLTADEARTVLAAYDAGDIPPDMLPLEAVAFLGLAQEDRREAVWLALLALLAIRRTASKLRPPQQRRAREQLEVRFGETVRRIAARPLSGNLAAFQQGMGEAITTYTIALATAGAGQMLDNTQLGRAQDATRRNLIYLALFAAQIAALAHLGRPMSYEAIATRSQLYGGMGIGEYYRAKEDGAPPGWVCLWVARDDPRTCAACSSYSGQYYLPGTGPMPAADCYGRSRCRCERVLEWNPEQYYQLTGIRV